MTCPSCNTPNRDDAKFCKKCGQPLRAEVAKVPETAGVNQTPVPVQESMNAAEDISTAPTQIISPQQMMAFHASRWQKDMEQGQVNTQASQTAQTSTAADQATSGATDVPAQGQPAQTSQSSMPSPTQNGLPPDIADMPTMTINPPGGNEVAPIPLPPPPPVDAEVTPNPPPPSMVEVVAPEVAAMTGPEAMSGGEKGPATAGEGPLAGAAAITSKEENEGVTQTPSDQAEQPKQPEKLGQSKQPEQTGEAVPTSDFPVLGTGTTLIGRYEITQVVSEDEQEHVYEVIDHQGYQHCWNCKSEQNREGDEFCIDCGAELLNAAYNMHEYPARENQNADANVLHGVIVNTFVDQGRTYVIEQVQSAENAFPNGVHLIAACDSDAGNVRRSEPNEDSTLVLLLQRVHESQATPSGVFIVADGLGGHENGQLASHMVINIIAERMVRELLAAPLVSEKAGESSPKLDEDALVALLQGAVEDANAAVCQVNQRDKTDMGSTITGFMVVGDFAYIINVGDSRTYMVRSGQIYQLTNDHSLVGQLVAGGLISPDEVYTHPQRSQIFRSLGDKLNVQIDIFKQQLHPGDMLLSCSDGLWEMVRDPQIESILNNAPDPQVACTQLIEAANTNGGEDNVSAVVVFVH
jgi:serine/threonine protein phosphatase PrpC